jgi:Galactose oxidase, central domain
MFRKSLILAATLLAGTSLGALAQTVTPLPPNHLPFDGVVYGFLLTDGSILFQGGLLQDFYRFFPDKSGSYVNGTYFNVASLPPDYIPYATSGGVLPDGRVLLIGGEYLLENQTVGLVFTLTNKMAVYDPKADTWTMVAPPKGWDFIGDSPWSFLADGRLLLGQKLTKKAAVLDPKTLTWTEVNDVGKDDVFAEEGFTLLPDGSVLTVNLTDHPFAQRFIPSPDPTLTQWVGAGETPENLQATDTNGVKSIPFDHGEVYHPPGEIGPAILRPDGTVFATGAACTLKGTGPDDCVVYSPVAHTAIFDLGFGGPLAATASGPWTAGPDFPNGEGAGDTYASLLPNGNVLVQPNPAGITEDPQAKAQARLDRIQSGAMHALAATAEALQQPACPPTQVYNAYEFNGATLIPEPQATFCGQPSMLLLPTGEVMLGGQAVYKTTGSFKNAWRPTIKTAPTSVAAGGSYEISGTQLNGLSQANSYGDEFQVATNYPLVRIINSKTGDVTYATTHDFSSMGVATGSRIVSARFDVPKTIELGNSTLEAVANGIPSQPYYITVVGAEAASP